MDIPRIRYFVEAAATGSFSDAARRLYTSQPNISKQIAALEKEINAKLFVRENRTISLTRAGKYLYEQFRDIPQLLDQSIITARALGRVDRGELTIGILAGQDIHGDIMKGLDVFDTHYPNIRYTLERNGFSGLRHALKTFQYDVIITLYFDVENDPDIAWETIKNQIAALAVSYKNPKSRLEQPSITDFADEPFVSISPAESYGGYNTLIRNCRNNGFSPNIVRITDNLDNLLFYVETGVGVAELDRNTRFERDNSVRMIPLTNCEHPDVVVAWLKNNINPDISRFIDCMKSYCLY
jgi:DNA-binding transcriptional LysR family regulator